MEQVEYSFDHVDIDGDSIAVISRDDHTGSPQAMGLEIVDVLFELAEKRGPQALQVLLSIALKWMHDANIEA